MIPWGIWSGDTLGFLRVLYSLKGYQIPLEVPNSWEGPIACDTGPIFPRLVCFINWRIHCYVLIAEWYFLAPASK